MRLVHYLVKHWEAPFTGVCRFSRDFSRAFPETINVRVGDRFDWRDGDVAVTDNSLCLEIPDFVRQIVVSHGSAIYHYEVDYEWRNEVTRRLAFDQSRMLTDGVKRTWIAPSAWIASKFRQAVGATRKDAKGYDPVLIPHHAEIIAGPRPALEKPVIIGDFRNANKGAGLIAKYAEAMPQYTFKQIKFDPNDDAARKATYLGASAYLCISLSEGAPYAVADAEAASLPIVSTMVGNCVEFAGDDWYGISTRFHPEFGVEEAANAIRAAVETGRRTPSYYSGYTFETWKRKWEEVIGK